MGRAAVCSSFSVRTDVLLLLHCLAPPRHLHARARRARPGCRCCFACCSTLRAPILWIDDHARAVSSSGGFLPSLLPSFPPSCQMHVHLDNNKVRIEVDFRPHAGPQHDEHCNCAAAVHQCRTCTMPPNHQEGTRLQCNNVSIAQDLGSITKRFGCSSPGLVKRPAYRHSITQTPVFGV